MLFKKTFGELVQDSLTSMRANTDITNTNIGSITRSLLEIINKNISDYYEILDINMAMGFLSTSEGYYLDLIGGLFNISRVVSSNAYANASSLAQKFYVSTGYLMDQIPTGVIPANTVVSSSDGTINYTVTTDTNFAAGVTEVYVPIRAQLAGSKYNIPIGILTTHNIGVSNVFTTNEKSIVTGTDVEGDANFRYRLMNATLSAEKANEIAIRLAALSVGGVANVIIRPYARGIGTYDVIVIPVEGIASDSLISNVQTAIDLVTACGITGTAIKPTIVPVNLSVTLAFTSDTTDYEKASLRNVVQTSIERYTVNIPLGGEFILNELRQQIMDVSPRIKDHIITCYYFRDEPCFLGNYQVYWDEMFYPNPDSFEPIVVS